jgi:hypothetical protein
MSVGSRVAAMAVLGVTHVAFRTADPPGLRDSCVELAGLGFVHHDRSVYWRE